MIRFAIKYCVTLILTLVLLQMPWSVMALSSDKEQPIYIEADRVDIDDINGISVYSGNVSFTQGSMRIQAETVTVYTDDKALTRFVGTGTPARYWQRPDGSEDEIRAEASNMEYFAESELLQLQGSAHLWRGDSEFSGNFIEYKIREDIVSARKAASGAERVQVVIQPAQKKEETIPAQ